MRKSFLVPFLTVTVVFASLFVDNLGCIALFLYTTDV